MIRSFFFFFFAAALLIATPALAGKVRTLPDGTQIECRTVLDVGDVYVGAVYGSRGSRGSRYSRGYGASGSRGRGVSVSTPYGGGRVGGHRECVVIAVPEAERAERRIERTERAIAVTSSRDSARIAELERERDMLILERDRAYEQAERAIAEAEAEEERRIEAERREDDAVESARHRRSSR